MILHLSQLPARVFVRVCCLTSLTPISRKFAFTEIWTKCLKWTFVPLCFRRVPSGQDRGFVQREVPCDQEAGVGTLLHCMAMLGHTVSHTHTHISRERALLPLRTYWDTHTRHELDTPLPVSWCHHDGDCNQHHPLLTPKTSICAVMLFPCCHGDATR